MKRSLLFALLAACSGNTGNIAVSLTTAPGSTVLDGVQTLRMTVTNPHQVLTAHRSSSGFDIALDLDATGESTTLLVDGLDANDNIVAVGASPSFPLGPLDGKIVVYMAAPNSIAAAPHSLDPARSEIGTGVLSYGALLAGGHLAEGTPSDALSIYNVFDHSLVGGQPLPAPRAGLVAAIGANGIAYLFGGRDAADTPTATLWRFDTKIAPSGQYADLGDKTGFARADEIAVPIGDEHFLVTGMPAADLYGLGGTLAAKADIPSLPSTGVGLLATDGAQTAIFTGPDGVVRFHAGTFSTLSIPAAARGGATAIMLPDGKAGIVCGAGDAVRIDAATGNAETIAGVPSEQRSDCAVAVTARHLLIAGGTTASGGSASVEIFDALTLAPIATQTLVVPRTGADAIALPNGQVLIAGGIDANGAPIATLELFTPAN